MSRNNFTGKPTPDPIPISRGRAVEFTNPTQGFAASEGCFVQKNNYVYATTDAGARWHHQLSAPASGGLASFTPVVASGHDAATGYPFQGYKARPASSLLYHSTDGGARWTKVRPPGPPRGYDVDLVNPSVWRLVAGRTVLATDNAGRTWTRIAANVALSQDRFSAVLFATPNVGWDLAAPGDRENGLHTTDGGRHWTTIHVPR